MPVSVRTCALLLAICAGTGCRAPEPPPTEQKPEPQDAAQKSEPQAANTELRDAIQQPIDKAKDVEKATQDAADQQRAKIEAAGG